MFFSWWQTMTKIFRSQSSRSRGRRRIRASKPHHSRLALESLENRIVPAPTAPYFSLGNGTFNAVTGSPTQGSFIGAANGDVIIPVRVDHLTDGTNSGMAGADLTIDFDPTVFVDGAANITVVQGPLVPTNGWTFIATPDGDGPGTISITASSGGSSSDITTTDPTGGGATPNGDILAYVTLRIKNTVTVGTQTDLNIDDSGDTSYDVIAHTSQAAYTSGPDGGLDFPNVPAAAVTISSASPKATLSIGSVANAAAGVAYTVPVTYDPTPSGDQPGGPGLDSTNVALLFDPTYINPSSIVITPGNLIPSSGWTLRTTGVFTGANGIDSTKDSIGLSESDNSSTDPIATNSTGTLFNIQFTLLGSAPIGTTVLNLVPTAHTSIAFSTVTNVSDANGPYTLNPTPTNATTDTVDGDVVITTSGPVLTPSSLPNGEVGIAYNQSITNTTGSGNGTVTLATSNVSNPTNLTISGGGTGTISVSGTPSSTGTISFDVTPTDGTGTHPAVLYTFNVVASVALTPASLPNGEVGVAYNQPITVASGGSGTITLNTSNVTNTTGLTVPASGSGSLTVSGTPTSSGTVTFTVTPTDAVGTGTSKVYTFTVVAGVVLNPGSLPSGEVGVAYSQPITASGGSGTITLNTSNVTNTTGLTIPASGSGSLTVSGTPTSSGTVSFIVKPTDAVGTGTGKVYTFTVVAGVVLTPSSLPSGEVGVGYPTQSITVANGGSGPFTLNTSNIGNLHGLSLGGSGTSALTVSGTPTSSGTVSFDVTPTDSIGTGANSLYSFTVVAGVVLTPSSLNNGEVGISYPTQSIAVASGGSGTITLNTSNIGNLHGLTLGGSGSGTVTVSGTPTSTGTVSFDVTPTDSIGTGASSLYSFTVFASVNLAPASPLNNGEVGVGYSQSITASGGSGTITLNTSNVTNTTGLTIPASGSGSITVSGTPTSSGTVTFTVTPTDTIGSGTGKVYTFTVVAGVVLTPSSLPSGEVGLSYPTQSITVASGGNGTITLNTSNIGNLHGLTLGGSGSGTITVSGTPTSSGTVSFDVTPTDSIGTGTSSLYSFTVFASVTLSPTSLPNGEVNIGYPAQSITGSGGSGTITLNTSNVGNLHGLTLGGSGSGTVTVSGTPTTTGIVSFDVTPTDSIGTGASTLYSFMVFASVNLAPSSPLNNGEVGVAYSQPITASGGSGTITLNTSNVTNTTGLTIPATGTSSITIGGIPTSTGTVSFTVTPTDASGTGVSKTYTFTVVAGVTLSPTSLPNGAVGVGYTTQSITGSGGNGTIALFATNVSNPANLTITGSGSGTITVSGTPTSSGTVSFDVTPSDGIGSGASTLYSFVVSPATASQLVVTAQPSSTATAGVAFVTQPVVKEEDQFGNVITSDSTHTVTVVRGSQGTGTLQGSNLTVTLTNGVATFSGLSYNVAEFLNLSFTTNAGVPAATSSFLLVSPAAASKLVVTQQPSTPATAGVAFLSQPVVKEEDSFGNVIATDSTHTVTAVRGSLGTAALQGSPLTVALLNGIATFSGLSYNKAEAMNIAFTTNASGVTAATSNNINVGTSSADSIVIASGSSQSATVNSAFGSALVVTVLDQFANPVSGVGVTFTAPGSGAGVSFVNASGSTNGNGQFSTMVTANTVAGGYTVTAAAAGVATPASFSLTNNPASAAKVAFLVQPGNTAGGSAINPALQAAVEDQFGNVLTSDQTDQVTLGVASGPGGFSAGSTTTATVHNGVATFSNLLLNTAGSYQLSENATGGLTGANSSAFNVTLAVTSFAATPTGFVATFSQPFNNTNSGNTAQLNLYNSSSSNDGAADVTLVSNTTGKAVTGSLVIDPSNQKITFIKTTEAGTNGLPLANSWGLLPADTYTATLVSGSQAFETPAGLLLDGLSDGTAGSGNYTATFTVSPLAANTVVVTVPDFARGPDSTDPINVPNNSSPAVGIPIDLTLLASTQTVAFSSGVTGGTFRLSLNGSSTGAITWSSTPADAGGQHQDRAGGADQRRRNRQRERIGRGRRSDRHRHVRRHGGQPGLDDGERQLVVAERVDDHHHQSQCAGQRDHRHVHAGLQCQPVHYQRWYGELDAERHDLHGGHDRVGQCRPGDHRLPECGGHESRDAGCRAAGRSDGHGAGQRRLQVVGSAALRPDERVQQHDRRRDGAGRHQRRPARGRLPRQCDRERRLHQRGLGGHCACGRQGGQRLRRLPDRGPGHPRQPQRHRPDELGRRHHSQPDLQRRQPGAATALPRRTEQQPDGS